DVGGEKHLQALSEDCMVFGNYDFSLIHARTSDVQAWRRFGLRVKYLKGAKNNDFTSNTITSPKLVVFFANSGR
ncbi:MAG: hypothetical protein AAGU11_03315, partial [Syntrophobacteraceae bacterium]